MDPTSHHLSTWLRLHRSPARRARLAVQRPPRRSALAESQADIVAGGFRAHPVGWVRCVWKRLDKSRSFGLSAEMAFWLFLSLLPLAAVAGLVTVPLWIRFGGHLAGLW